MTKNTQSGFIIPLVIGLIALLVAAGAYLAYKNEKGQVEQAAQTNSQFLALTTTNAAGAAMSSTTMYDNVHTNAVQSSSSGNTGTATSSFSSNGWQTYTNSQYAFTFKYPASLDSSFASLSNPPQVIVTINDAHNPSIDSNGCYVPSVYAGEPSAYKPTQMTINGVAFCQSNDLNPGAGSISGDYYYTTLKDNAHVTIGYGIRVPNGCGAYEGGSNYQACEDFGNNYNTIVIQPLQQSAGSLTFTNNN